MNSPAAQLVELCRELGEPSRGLAILAEGNASTHGAEGTFWIKASGTCMDELGADQVVEVKSGPILETLERELSDAEVKSVLSDARVDQESEQTPSVETFMHAWLLSLPDVNWIAHTHPVTLVALISCGGAKERAEMRLFPDEVVCCGPRTCWVPYADPGLPLAREIRSCVTAFIAKYEETPKTIWLQNHGLIVLGRSFKESLSGTLMSEKAAKVWLGALSSGCSPNTMTKAQVERIHTRPDEHYRQRLLWQVGNVGL